MAFATAAPAEEGERGSARYGGVAPGQASDREPLPARGGWTNLTWLGFVPEEEGRARVFAQVGRDVTPRQEIVEDELWILLDRVRPASRNAARPLDVRFFDTDLERVWAERVSRRPEGEGEEPALPDGTKIAVSFEGGAEPREAEVSIVREEDGFHYVFLDFSARESE